jgi:multicomponent Na+:H+ antiporter subunit E
MGIKNFLLSFILLFTVWLLLNNSLRYDILIVGGGLALFLSIVFYRFNKGMDSLKLNPKAILYLIIYMFVFLVELIKSNIDVALIVISPSLPINPGIVKVKTKLKTKMGRLLLANSITLTPGTLSVEIKGDFLYIHWINVSSKDVKSASKKIVKGFEKYLEVFYG